MRIATLTTLAGCLVALATAFPEHTATARGQQEAKPDADLDRKIEKLVEQLGDNKFRVREAATKELTALGKRAVPALRKALRSTDADVRLRAQVILNEIESGVPFLVAELTDKDPKVRKSAAERLEQLGDKAKTAVPALVKALKDSDSSVREAVASAIAAIEPDNKAIADKGPARASVNGKYRKLLRKFKVEEDKGSYGNFTDYGYYTGTSWRGHNNLPAGYWVYVYPHWYIWGEERVPTPPRRG